MILMNLCFVSQLYVAPQGGYQQDKYEVSPLNKILYISKAQPRHLYTGLINGVDPIL